MVTMTMPTKVQGVGGGWLKCPDHIGTFLMQITQSMEQAVDSKQKPLDGWKSSLSVICGTVPGAEGLQFDLILWNPKPDDEKQWDLRKQAAYLIATGLCTEKQLGTPVSIELADATDRFVFVTLGPNKDGDRLQLHYADIFHIDDPRAAKFPRSERHFALLPAHMRRDPKSFDLVALTGKADAVADAGGGGGGTANTANGVASSNGGAAASGAAAGGVNIDDL
jgi:hypothetical protein